MKYYHCPPDQDRTLLIGYSVDAWAFCLVVNKYPDLCAWKKAWEVPGSRIKDSNGKTISPDEMEMIITFLEGDAGTVREYLYSFRNTTFGDKHNLVHRNIGAVFSGYCCVGNEDCWDLCRAV